MKKTSHNLFWAPFLNAQTSNKSVTSSGFGPHGTLPYSYIGGANVYTEISVFTKILWKFKNDYWDYMAQLKQFM